MAEYIAKEIIGEVGEKKMRIGVALKFPLEPIVRCRDCKIGKDDLPLTEVCSVYLANGCDPDGFCAWAERDA